MSTSDTAGHHTGLRDLLDRQVDQRRQDRAQQLAAAEPAQASPRRIPNTEWSRYNGVPLPAGARLIDRRSRYGNPFTLIEHGGKYTRAQSLHLHRLFLRGDPDAVAQAHADGWPTHWPYGAELVALIRTNLAGHDVVCTGCGLDEACHGDLVLRVARGEES